jgi:hypothetical protein
MKKLFLFVLLHAIAQSYGQGGLLLNRNGVELSYLNQFSTDLNALRLGGKLDNITLGCAYLNYESSYKYNARNGIGADAGYDWNWKKGWGLNSGFSYYWYQNPNNDPYYNYKGEASRLTFNCYKKIDLVEKATFIKPFIGLQGRFESSVTKQIYSQWNGQTYTPKEHVSVFNSIYLLANLGVGLGFNIKNITLGLTASYTTLYFTAGIIGVQCTAGYNFYTEKTFDGKSK